MLGVKLDNFLVEDIGPDGRCFGMHGNIKVHVDKALPGERLDIAMFRPFRQNKLHGEGKILRITQPSSHRVESICKHFAYCGGCQWLHTTYTEQLRIKEENVKRLLAPLAGSQTEFLPIVPAPEVVAYRNRISFTFSNCRWMSPEELADKETMKQPAAGFARKGQFDRVMNIEHCHLADAFSNELMHGIRDFALKNNWSFYDPRKEKGFLRLLTIRKNESGRYMVIVTFGEDASEHIEQLMLYVKNSFPPIDSLWYSVQPERDSSLSSSFIHYAGNKSLQYKMDALTFEISPASFYQTNTKQAHHLYHIAKNFAQPSLTDVVYDLYTGTGTLALFVAHQAKKVIGIEAVTDTVENAKANAMHNSISNAVFIAGDLKDTFNHTLFAEQGLPDVVITDPPRSGMHAVGLQNLLHCGAKKIVYVSCNPVTLTRDLQVLSEKYAFVKSQVVDMFPQTSHIENVMLLVLK
jgi:23S rRNA (uracil1939-C5)-methyltransferase